MDFNQIGAMKLFSELGQLIEEDECNQIKLSDLNSDIMKKKKKGVYYQRKGNILWNVRV
jgi:hypothetical protein